MKINENNKCDCKCIHQDRTELAIETLNEIKIYNELAEFYKSFADGTRLKILSILDKVERMCVNDISVSLNMTKSAISHQLSYLKDCHLVKCEKLGKVVFYSLADEHVKDILEKGIEHLQEME